MNSVRNLLCRLGIFFDDEIQRNSLESTHRNDGHDEKRQLSLPTMPINEAILNKSTAFGCYKETIVPLTCR